VVAVGALRDRWQDASSNEGPTYLWSVPISITRFSIIPGLTRR